MQVKMIYLVDRECINAHCSMGVPGKQGVLSHDEAKEYFGTPCDPGTLRFFQMVDESEVLDKIRTITGLGHRVEVEYT